MTKMPSLNLPYQGHSSNSVRRQNGQKDQMWSESEKRNQDNNFWIYIEFAERERERHKKAFWKVSFCPVRGMFGSTLTFLLLHVEYMLLPLLLTSIKIKSTPHFPLHTRTTSNKSPLTFQLSIHLGVYSSFTPINFGV